MIPGTGPLPLWAFLPVKQAPFSPDPLCQGTLKTLLKASVRTVGKAFLHLLWGEETSYRNLDQAPPKARKYPES